MKTSNNQPADTRIMGIVHDALRRDLQRAETAITRAPPPSEAQRVAIAAHVRWLMDFLHRHHAGEDQGLWPLVRAHNPAAGDLLDQMDTDHARIGPQIDQVQNAAATYGTDASPAGRQGLAAAIELLRSVLDPHLRREEDEMMPVVSRSITHAQWEAFNYTNNVKPKSKKDLGHEGHWLIDNLDPERYDVVVRHVPAVPRFILIHAMARPYRKECATRWGLGVQIQPLHRQRPVSGADSDLIKGRFRFRGQVSLYIEAVPQGLYDVVADVTRIGERSAECHTAQWLPGPPPRTVGARFRGRNKSGGFRWSRVCEIVTADLGHAFAYRTVPERVDLSRHDSTTWAYEFTPEGTGTNVSHSYEIMRPPLRPFIAIYKRTHPHHFDMRPAMMDNLTALKQIAEAGAATGAAPQAFGVQQA
jgi:iron-sulfur cluster repair protein YtfE (RIC family)